MKLIYFSSIAFYIFHIIENPSYGQTTDDSNLSPNWSYCFEFTWFGPGYDNFTRYNNTCAEYLDETRAIDIPCKAPIVITYDGTPPDIEYLWNHHKSSVLCRRSRNQVCAKYSYIYNGLVNNATYMCTKVSSVGEGAITSGCYTTTYDGYSIQLCVCESTPGIYKPCNAAHINSISFYLITFIIMKFIFLLSY